LHAPENFVGQHVASDTNAENVAESLVENQLRRSARIDAAQYRCERPLPVTRLVDLLEQISVGLKVVDEAVVAFLEEEQRTFRRHGGLAVFCMCAHRAAPLSTRPK